MLALVAVPAGAQEDIWVARSVPVNDMKAVFATVESTSVIAARARINGTLADLAVDEGDFVKAGQVVANIGDEKLSLQVSSLDSRIGSAQAQLDKATIDLKRTKELFDKGAVSKARLDDAQTQYSIAQSGLKAATSDRDVIRRQMSEGGVIAPVTGRVLKVPVTKGAVVMPGEVIAMIADQDYILRLSVPERHARYMKKDDSIHLANGQLGRIETVYPQIENGRVIADAVAEGLGDYFVGERVLVWVAGEERKTIVVPAHYILSQYGIDFVKIIAADGRARKIAVQRGIPMPLPDMSRGVEILSGVREGDKLVKP
ncbi:MAG: efflux RND transporter periplasmic adaptor subunit [Micavibrio aeruginosavorus]|uniref:Efflux RND transporter periplasmic adaptor subunit n=1 Tax=Micavibrio aeruginosavorus TaxID=349221 RepID=A0A7T5UHX0_9BACT|nr:MAG: efflux RND transporter periplasmic adaptor subunit [Micavibrio aeruginosavorus]